MNTRRHGDEPTHLCARDEQELDALLTRLRAPRDEKDPLAGFVDAARALDAAPAHTIESCIDAAYEEYAVSTRRVGALEFLAVRLRHSSMLRLVAASIVGHVLVLPVLAFAVFVPDPEPSYTLVFELPSDRPPVVETPDEGLEALDAQSLLAPDTERTAPTNGGDGAAETPSNGDDAHERE